MAVRPDSCSDHATGRSSAFQSSVGVRAHPGQAGYGLIAWLVLHNGWSDWLQLS